MKFEIAKLAITRDQYGSLQVGEGTVRWKGKQKFSINNSNPECTDPNVVLPPGQPLSIGQVTQDTNPGWRVAKLTFSGLIEEVHSDDVNDWHPHYNECRTIKQLMQVEGGYGAQTLTIELSCAVHPKLAFLAHVIDAIHAPARAAVAIVQVLYMLFRRVFGTTKKLAQ